MHRGILAARPGADPTSIPHVAFLSRAGCLGLAKFGSDPAAGTRMCHTSAALRHGGGEPRRHSVFLVSLAGTVPLDADVQREGKRQIHTGLDLRPAEWLRSILRP